MKRLGAASLAGIALAAIAVISVPRPGQEPPSRSPSAVTQSSQAPLSEAIRRVAPAVVSIQVVSADAEEGDAPRATGSGVIVDRDGHVVTNARVIENARRIQVGLAEGTLFDAELVGDEKSRNVAVLKIRGRGLPAAQLGSSRSLPIGAWVAALGRTADGQGSAAVGVLSARDREILTRDDRLYMSLLQTDAAINPENSGGPLVGPGGEVVGISTAIVPPAYAQGISFAIASEVASRVAADLVRYGRMRLAWLGIQYEDLADQSRGRLRVEDTRGIVVKKVLPGTPAARAGLRQDDVIVGFDQFPIRAKKDFRWRIVQARPGQKITLKVLRRGQPLSLYATLSEASED